jgi:hypothetical protein
VVLRTNGAELPAPGGYRRQQNTPKGCAAIRVFKGPVSRRHDLLQGRGINGEFSYPVGEPRRLEAVFSHGAHFHLHDTPLNVDQHIAALDRGRVTVRATAENTAELRWWLLGFAELVEVLAPADLRHEVQARATAMAALYQQRPSSKATHGRSDHVY